MYCFDQEYYLRTNDLVDEHRHCRFLNSLLTAKGSFGSYKHSMVPDRNNHAKYFNQNPDRRDYCQPPVRSTYQTRCGINSRYSLKYLSIIEQYHLRAVLDTLKHYDIRTQNNQVFKTDDADSTLKVLLQLAYNEDTEISEAIIRGKLEDYYGQNQLESFMFFALTDENRSNYQAIAKKLRGQTYKVLGSAGATNHVHGHG